MKLLNAPHKPGEKKVIYLAPLKALCQERLRDWSQKFKSAGITVVELTGDSEIQDFHSLVSADVIVSCLLYISISSIFPL